MCAWLHPRSLARECADLVDVFMNEVTNTPTVQLANSQLQEPWEMLAAW